MYQKHAGGQAVNLYAYNVMIFLQVNVNAMRGTLVMTAPGMRTKFRCYLICSLRDCVTFSHDPVDQVLCMEIISLENQPCLAV